METVNHGLDANNVKHLINAVQPKYLKQKVATRCILVRESTKKNQLR